MKTKAPPTRRKFAGEWDEIDYLYHKLLYWLYEREAPAQARPYARRLEQLLERAPGTREAVRAEECRSLICETRGDWRGAIKHRENEIRLVRKLYKLSHGGPGWDYVKERYGYDDLGDRLDLLAILYHDSSNLEAAIRTLEESKRLAEEHGFAFDGQDILDDYLAERRATPRDTDGKSMARPAKQAR